MSPEELNELHLTGIHKVKDNLESPLNVQLCSIEE